IHIGGATSTTTISALTTTNSTSTTTIQPTGSCLASSTKVQIFNGNFSTGTFVGWNASGSGFGSVPVNIVYANSPNVSGYYNHTWTGYNGDFFASTYHGGFGIQPGNLTSLPFQVTEPYLNFRIISPDYQLIYVQVVKAGTNVPLITTHYNTWIAGNPYPTSQFLNASMPLSVAICQNVSIKVVAQALGGYINSRNYIAIGDFYLSKVPIATPGIIVNQTISG
ncbi:MAG: hypothetical protein KGH49_00830, partial [Candidatus Micrarchaeota archaeon]|nr:hypothetical protein [Candidatus Micrarchaeota archaeon]